jgi:hypothetical protein
VKREVSGKMQSRSRIIAAAVMALIAITTIAYATISAGSIGINPEDINISYPSPSINIYVPKGGVSSYSGTITIKASSSITVRFRAEIIVDDALYRDLRSLIVRIKDGTGVKARLTLSQPWDEFDLTLSTNVPVNLDVYVVVAAGSSDASGSVELRIVPVGIS